MAAALPSHSLLICLLFTTTIFGAWSIAIGELSRYMFSHGNLPTGEKNPENWGERWGKVLLNEMELFRGWRSLDHCWIWNLFVCICILGLTVGVVASLFLAQSFYSLVNIVSFFTFTDFFPPPKISMSEYTYNLSPNNLYREIKRKCNTKSYTCILSSTSVIHPFS